MFDESFFVALSFVTVIGAFLYLKLPQRLLSALDTKSAEIADALEQARKLREDAEALLADYEARSAARLQKSLEATKITLKITDWFLLLEASMGNPLP